MTRTEPTVLAINLRSPQLCDQWIGGLSGRELVFYEGDSLAERRVSLEALDPKLNVAVIDRHTIAAGYPYHDRQRGELRLVTLAQGSPWVTQVFRCEQPTAYGFGVGLRACGDTLVVRSSVDREHREAEDWFACFHRDGEQWKLEAELRGDDDLRHNFAIDHDQCVTIGRGSGALRWYRRDADGTWSLVDEVKSSLSGAACLRGDRLVVGGAGEVATYRLDGQTLCVGPSWRVARAGTYPSVGVALHGDRLVVGCDAKSGKVRGTVRLYGREGEDWHEERKLRTGFVGSTMLFDGQRLLYERADEQYRHESILVYPAALVERKSARKTKRALVSQDRPQLVIETASTPGLSAYEKVRQLTLTAKVKRAPGLGALMERRPGLESLWVERAELLSPPPHRAPLRRLTVYSASVADLSFLVGFPDLEELTLGNRGSKISDFGPLRHTPKLEQLRVPRHRANSLTPLTGLTRLQTLSMPQSKALVLDGLEGCPELREVDMNQCPAITSLVPLQAARKLHTLKLRGAAIRSLEPLHGANELSVLFVERTKLVTLEGIAEGLPALRLLWLHKTKVRDISPLVGLQGLTELDLSSLKIRDFSFLASLTSLEYLDLFGTSFDDLSLLASLPSLRWVRLARTPIARDDPRVESLDELLRSRDEEQGAVSFSEAATRAGAWTD